MNFSSLVSLLLIYATSTSQAQEMQGCQYQYFEQPPATLSCDPSSQVLLECSVLAPPSVLASVGWFHTNGSGPSCHSSLQRLITNMEEVVIREQRQFGVESLAVRSQLIVSGGLATGNYWCQIELEDGGVFTLSHALTVLPADAYDSLPACSIVIPQSKMEVTCANKILDNLTIPTDCNAATDAVTTIPPATLTNNPAPIPSKEDEQVASTNPTSTDEGEQSTADTALSDATEVLDDKQFSVQLCATIAVVVLLAVVIMVLAPVLVYICLRARNESKKLKLQRESQRRPSSIRSNSAATDYLVPQPYFLPPSLRQSFALTSLRFSHEYEDIPDCIEEGFGAADKSCHNAAESVTMTRNAAYRAYIIDSSNAEWLREPSMDSQCSVIPNPINCMYTNLTHTPEQ